MFDFDVGKSPAPNPHTNANKQRFITINSHIYRLSSVGSSMSLLSSGSRVQAPQAVFCLYSSVGRAPVL